MLDGFCVLITYCTFDRCGKLGLLEEQEKILHSFSISSIQLLAVFMVVVQYILNLFAYLIGKYWKINASFPFRWFFFLLAILITYVAIFVPLASYITKIAEERFLIRIVSSRVIGILVLFALGYFFNGTRLRERFEGWVWSFNLLDIVLYAFLIIGVPIWTYFQDYNFILNP